MGDQSKRNVHFSHKLTVVEEYEDGRKQKSGPTVSSLDQEARTQKTPISKCIQRPEEERARFAALRSGPSNFAAAGPSGAQKRPASAASNFAAAGPSGAQKRPASATSNFAEAGASETKKSPALAARPPPPPQMPWCTPEHISRKCQQTEQPPMQPSPGSRCPPPQTPGKHNQIGSPPLPKSPVTQYLSPQTPGKSQRTTSPRSIGGRSVAQSPSSVPSDPNSYVMTSSDEGNLTGTSNPTSRTHDSSMMSSLESGFDTPAITPPNMSPAPEMLPSGLYATDTNVVRPNLDTFLIIIDYMVNTFCEDQRQRIKQIYCLVKNLMCLQGNELNDSILMLRDLVIRRGRMLPELYDYLKGLLEELKEIFELATNRHRPVPNLCYLAALANKPQLDPYLSQGTYLEIIKNMRIFVDWSFIWIFKGRDTNEELKDRVEDLLSGPEGLRDFALFIDKEHQSCFESLAKIQRTGLECQAQIDRFLQLWEEADVVRNERGEIVVKGLLNKPYPDDMFRRYVELPDLDTPELEAGVAPGCPAIGTEPGRPVPSLDPRPLRASSAPPAFDAPGPSGLQSRRFANAPVPGPGLCGPDTTSSTESSGWSPGFERFAPVDPELLNHVTARFRERGNLCPSPTSSEE